MKKALSVFLAILLLVSCCGAAALAADTAAVSDYEEMISLLRGGLLARQTEIRFRYTGDDYRDPTIDDLCAPGEDPAAGDYLRLSFNGALPSVTPNDDGSYTLTAAFYTTAEMEARVDAFVDETAPGLVGETDFDTAYNIYDYLCNTVTFDLENLYDNTVLMKYTAYGAITDGRAVCQGFAALYYRLALAAGLECRTVTGKRADTNHAWNIVKLDDKWYHVDGACGSQLLDNTGYFMKPLFGGYKVVYNGWTASEIQNYTFATDNTVDHLLNGTVNYQISWTLDETTGELNICGNGEINKMLFYFSFSYSPQAPNIGSPFYKNTSIRKAVFSEGITQWPGNLFLGCSNLEEVSLPSTLDFIVGGNLWLNGCDALRVINVAENSPYYCWKNNCLIDKRNGNLRFGTEDSVIPDDGSVKTIGSKAFKNAPELTHITIPEGVTEIQNAAFSNCKKLASVSLPQSLVSIDGFSGCTALTEITLPDGLETIEDGAFTGTGIKSIHIPAGTNTIEGGAFSSTPLEEITVAEENPVFHVENNCLIDTEQKTLVQGCNASQIPSDGSVTSIGQRAFAGMKQLAEVTVPESVLSIGEYAFLSCSGLTKLSLPRELTTIESHTFSGCSGLTVITLPDTVNSIGDHAFASCHGLTTALISGNISNFGSSVFSDCTRLKNLIFLTDTAGLEIFTRYDNDNNSYLFDPNYLDVNSTCTIRAYPGGDIESYAANKNYAFRALSACTAASGRHSAVLTEAVPATCTDIPYSAGIQCPDCGEWLAEPVPAGDPLGHEPAAAVREDVIEPTCTTEGSYNSVVRCVRCSEILSTTPEKLAMRPHADADRNGYCDDCGAYICTHSETKVVNARAAACTAPGYSGDTVCEICGVTLTYGETIPAAGHTPAVGTPAVPATCLARGRTEQIVCGVCGTVLAASRETGITGHSDAAGDGLCDVCFAPVHCALYGACGENTYWYIEDEILGLSGSGAVTEAAWNAHNGAFDTVYIKEGVTAVDCALFSGSGNLTRIFAPAGATVSNRTKPVLRYTYTSGVVAVDNAQDYTVYDILNTAYTFCSDRTVNALRFGSIRLLGADGAPQTEYDILKNGKIIDENHFRIPSGAVLSDLRIKPLGYPSFNAVLSALGNHPDRNLILSLTCTDLLPDNLKADAAAYTEQLVIRFVDEPIPPQPDQPAQPDNPNQPGNSEEHKSFLETAKERFEATLAALMAVFKKLFKFFRK